MLQAELDDLLAHIRTQFAVEFEDGTIDELPLHLLTVRNMPDHLNRLIARKAIANPLRDLPLWAKVWPAAFVLGRYLRRLGMEGKSLLEVGAGCGVTSCLAARYGFSQITISDVADMALQFARANVLKNNLESLISVLKVDVAHDSLHQNFDCIVASEILYLDDLHAPLLTFLQRHLAPGGKVALCTDIARKKPLFFAQAAAVFTMEEHLVRTRSVSQDGTEERHIYTIHLLERP